MVVTFGVAMGLLHAVQLSVAVFGGSHVNVAGDAEDDACKFALCPIQMVVSGPAFVVAMESILTTFETVVEQLLLLVAVSLTVSVPGTG